MKNEDNGGLQYHDYDEAQCNERPTIRARSVLAETEEPTVLTQILRT